MATLTNEEVVRRYAAASVEHDLPALTALRHPDWMVFWPQSGELVHGNEAFAEIIANYPGGAPKREITRIVGAEDRWVLTAANTVMAVVGSGDFWWSEWRVTYPNGDVYLVVDLIELRDRLVHRETVYWAAPFEAPAWRAPWVERPA
ncbi:MAG TPA: nuclear transport factor 2 family protein [Candidatus Limnocylindria bacterium]|nr:nuclear transport factor 2 family protein [Candidatus Limnocylindria bacterium]